MKVQSHVASLRSPSRSGGDGIQDRRGNINAWMTDHMSWPDVREYLVKIRLSCRQGFLDAHGITCLFDVDCGALSASRCKIISQIVSALLIEICRGASPNARGGQITVSLCQTGQVWVLAVMDEGVRAFNNDLSVGMLPSVQGHARSLNGTSCNQLKAGGAITAVLFNAMPWQAKVIEPPSTVTIEHVLRDLSRQLTGDCQATVTGSL